MLPTLRTLLPRRLPRSILLPALQSRVPPPSRPLSTGGKDPDDPWSSWNGGAPSDPASSGLDWDSSASSWSTGLTKDHFDGDAVGHQIPSTPAADEDPRAVAAAMDEEDEILGALHKDNKESKAFVDSWDERFRETCKLLKQVREPGIRGEYLKSTEKDEMYRLHKENPEVSTVEKLAKDYRIMRQRVHAILWLKEMEEEESKKLGKPLDDSVDQLLDNFPDLLCVRFLLLVVVLMVVCACTHVHMHLRPCFVCRFFNSHDREFHVASLRYKPDFKIMPEGWDGTTRDPDEVHYEISMKEDQMLYEEFVERLNFNKMKVAGKVLCNKYARRRPAEGWSFTVEKLGPRDKRGGGGGWKFVSLPDGSSRALNDMEKMYVKRETPKRRRRILPPLK